MTISRTGTAHARAAAIAIRPLSGFLFIASAALLIAAGVLGLRFAAAQDIEWAEKLLRVLSLRDHNTRIALFGAGLLGLAGGLIGTYMLLRKRALVGDALSHATLPGVCGGFVLMVMLGGVGKELLPLLLGAAVSGMLGVACLMALRAWTPIKEDAALGIVLSVSFGLGVAMLGIIQTMPTGNQAGLEQFIYGRTASMITRDVQMIAGVCIIVAFACAILYKEFLIVCFDEPYAQSLAFSGRAIDAIMMMLVTMVTVIGLQAVGLILMVAMLVIPPAAARFWSDRLPRILLIAAFIGLCSAASGAAASALAPRMPAGAIIVCFAAMFFVFSALFGPARGVVPFVLDRRNDRRTTAQQHVLRGMYEWIENTLRPADSPDLRPVTAVEISRIGVPASYLQPLRSWTPRELRSAGRSLMRRGLIARASSNPAEMHQDASDDWTLTESGLQFAAKLIRNHRLWELYMIHHADVAPSHVDRTADTIEHVLDPAMIAQLEAQLARQNVDVDEPPSPHITIPHTTTPDHD